MKTNHTFEFNGHTVTVTPESFQLPDDNGEGIGALNTTISIDGSAPLAIGGCWIYSEETAGAENERLGIDFAATPNWPNAVYAGNPIPYEVAEIGDGGMAEAARCLGIRISDTDGMEELLEVLQEQTGKLHDDLWRIEADDGEPEAFDESGRLWIVSSRSLFYGALKVADWTRCSVGYYSYRTSDWECDEDTGGGDVLPETLSVLMTAWGIEDRDLPDVPEPDAPATLPDSEVGERENSEQPLFRTIEKALDEAYVRDYYASFDEAKAGEAAYERSMARQGYRNPASNAFNHLIIEERDAETGEWVEADGESSR